MTRDGARRRTAAVREWLDRTSETGNRATANDLAGPFRFLFWLARSQSRRIAWGGVLGTLWMVGLAVPPWVLSRAVDQGLVARDTRALIRWALVLLVVTVLNALLGIARHRTMTKVRMDASFRAVRAAVGHTSRLGASLPGRVSTGEVVTVGIADVYTVAMALTVAGPGVGAVVAYAVVAVVLFTTSPLLAAVVLAGVPLLAVAVGPFLQRIERTGGEYRVHQGRLTTRLVDVLAGLRVLNGLGGKAFVAERYEQQSQGLVGHGYRVAGPASWVGALSTGLPALFLAAVVWLSARMAATGAITIGEVVAVYGYVAVLVVPVSAFIEGGGDIARARVAGQRIIDLLNLPAARDNKWASPSGCGPLADPASGVIVRPGSLTALVAARPAETRTVIERLGRLSTDAGATWAGVPIDDVARAELRRRLVVADNDAEVFAGTVREVIAGRLEPDDSRIRAALRVAVAEDVVEALPGGLDATIAAGGSDLSGGQRQRIRLARAVYAAPDVLLAVEPTSAVDANTEAAMIDRIREARRDTTTVITTSSPLVLDRADEVVVLIDGKASSVGTHTELLRTDPYYRELVSRGQDDR
ncbi:ABC-type multidrug transport system fused ATPase/permease subunit [Kribbella sp. VKM Ac-2571]|uniref:ABC transporter transmembrane domain-containing protein n=1 Tax=Kribbella sp. VKM Ac-2571 TaxID=2512222 RepID=UPI00105F82D8|nr:ABC transporter ATP-binding protein [Kribbella sp. VKM Ac-2571]TDO46095.1 ABC-type multidrug transport system fused ATPase/permease subunit [Kribbella sp. VKM Ac-2571]